MIIKLKKQLYRSSEEYLLQSWLGDFLCKIIPLPGGYYFYNKESDQLAQISFQKKEALIATMSVNPGYPGTLRVSGTDNAFVFSGLTDPKEDKKYLKNVPNKTIPAYAVWGSVKKYAFDLYDGGTILANVAPSESDPTLFSIQLHPAANLIGVVTIVLALEKLVNG